MIERGERVRRPFGGYLKRHGVSEDTELTHVEPGTPGGEYLRRFWQPVALSEELGELPIPVRMLGEDLVLFRTAKGELGLLERHCSHRGSSLEFGICSDAGIRCCYHGWHYAIDGTILETPNDPASGIKDRICHPAYPVEEHAGIIFAYMGPPDECPNFPKLDTWDEDGNELIPFSLHYPCNWLQVIENTMDPVHSVFLHTRISGVQFAESWGQLPEVDYVETPLGVMNVNMRRWKDMVWLRTTEIITPNINQAGGLYEPAESEKTLARVSLTRWMRPVDSTNTLVIGWRHVNDRVDPGMGVPDDIGLEKIDFVGQTKGRDYQEAQREPGDFEAIVYQRPIAIHALENLCGSDRGVALLRRVLRRNIRAIADGKRLESPILTSDGPHGTFTQDTIREIPATGEADDEQDRALLREVGTIGSADLIDSFGLDPEARAQRIDAALRPFKQPA